ncbi:heparinase II/III family protein [Janthinobacterium sp. GW460P]|uniref:heparinase II/III domain-containing protein n=2 Tax=unclassified Janthinobacterium TaxID=2610881 RepID=UPI000A326193|nr:MULTISPECIES: heparinase II/III family protein [unclassified Janthinobacterium]MCC7705062.1 heparinase II/III family protein [Janthinobacterium sp. GW460P]MCC7710564.1 heparinase II/III family protein [Janthinobacterium sp. GW460W]
MVQQRCGGVAFLPRKMAHAVLGMFCLLSSAAMAQLPAPIKQGHPRLFVNQASFDALKPQLPNLPATFPAAGGSISLELFAGRKDALDSVNQPIFGEFNASRNGFFIRHVDSYDSPAGAAGESIGFQVGFQVNGLAQYLSVARIDLKPDAWSTIQLSWNSQTHKIDLKVNGVVVPTGWRTVDGTGATPPMAWQADGQISRIGMRRNETMRNFRLLDGGGHELWQAPAMDALLNKAWYGFMERVDGRVSTLQTCPLIPPASGVPELCNVATGSRGTIYETAQMLAMAYRLTGNAKYLDGALNYLDKLLVTAPVAGGEWSSGGRVGALGILYDWLFAEMGARAVPDAVGFGTYRELAAQRIKDTIAADTGKGSENLFVSMCGYQPLYITSTSFDCKKKPVYEGWDRSESKPSIANFYISGHPFSAVNNATVGLLAIVDEHPEVLPMIETSYAHYEKGFLAARALISIDGGHHMGFAYGVSSIPERLLLWRSALESTGAAPLLQADWQARLIYPYIYGLRHDGSFPASGDNFTTPLGSTLIGQLALGAVTDTADGVAGKFYREHVVASRGSHEALILERLLWPVQLPAAPLESLELSRHFRTSGQVLMRDSWDYANATLLEFKSTSFIAENHQHFDQNSFSLNYKAPLLLDTGLYEDYGSSHWWNYYTRSIAHNTLLIFDRNERFTRGDNEYSNDGGQWFYAPRQGYPTIEEISPAGPNALDGIVRYENTPQYTYTSGNASKAYASSKLDTANGFVRNVLFLRSPSFWPKPVTVVFDSVRSKQALPATFLLHTANDPVSVAPGVTALGNGQYQLGYQPGQERIATIRNGDGMLTAQTILPLNASVRKVGGAQEGGNGCAQTNLDTGAVAGNGADCRFTVRRRQADGSYLWRNQTPRVSKQQSSTSDVGAWRLEVAAPAAPALNAPEYFLHVLAVADNDGGTGPAAAPGATRLPAAANTEALLLGGQLHALFNRDVAPAARMDWTSPLAGGAILATGLKPGAHYALTSAPAAGGYAWSLAEAADGAGTYLSSDQGVLSIE